MTSAVEDRRSFVRKQTVIVYALVASAAVFVGCSGGGGSGSSVPTTGGNVPSQTQATGRATFSLTIPAATSASASNRNPQYISSNTQSMSVAVGTGTATPGAPVVSNLTPGSPGCTAGAAGGTTCTVTIAAPIGSDTFVVTLYSGTNGSGSILSTGTIAGTVAAATANTFPLTLGGTVAAITVSVTNGNNVIPGGYATTLPVVVTAKDASGATIIGPGNYSNPITLANADTSGITALSTTTVTSPGTTVTLAYAPTDANSGVLNISGLPVGATKIGASATGVAASAITSGTFQYIADRFFGFGHARTLTGTGTVTITTYNGLGTPSPSPSTYSYAIQDVLTAHGNVTLNGVSGMVDSNHVYTYTQTSPAPVVAAETNTTDYYRKDTLNASGAIVYLLFQNQVDANSGAINSPLTTDVPGTTTFAYTYPNPGQFEEDVLPHAATTWTNNFVPFSEVFSGAQVATQQWNADGSITFSQTVPSVLQQSQTAGGPASQFNGTSGVTTSIGVPIPSGTGMVIPVAQQTTSPAPGPTSTFSAADWYPNNGQIVTPVFAQPYTMSFVAIPGSCGVPSTIATQAWAVAYAQTWLRIPIFQYRTRTVTDYYVPGGIGFVCQTYAETATSYRFGTGVILSQTAINYAYGVQNANQLSIRRQP